MVKTVWLALVVVLVLAPPETEADITCATVENNLSPCIDYIVSGANARPPVECCRGIQTLVDAAQATPDRQQVCSCLKSVATSVSPTLITNAAALPGKCGVPLPYTITPNFDCSTVQ